MDLSARRLPAFEMPTSAKTGSFAAAGSRWKTLRQLKTLISSRSFLKLALVQVRTLQFCNVCHVAQLAGSLDEASLLMLCCCVAADIKKAKDGNFHTIQALLIYPKKVCSTPILSCRLHT
jgi:hypothetical protein